MKVLPLDSDRLLDFVDYCRKYRNEHDASNLYDDDLKIFSPNADNPTYILTDDSDDIIGAASLLHGPEYSRSGTSRFRIFHSAIPSKDAYKTMLDAVSRHLNTNEHIDLFIPEEKIHTRSILEELGFGIERCAWVLKKKNENPKPSVFPAGYSVKPFRKGKDELEWCNICNIAFSVFSWHVDIAPESVVQDESSDTYIKDGMLMLWHGEKPVGVLRTEKDPDYNYFEIGPIAILPAYQGKGLGRNLLRFGLEASCKLGFEFTTLSVNGENNKAAELYFSEGFTKEALMLCYGKKHFPQEMR